MADETLTDSVTVDLTEDEMEEMRQPRVVVEVEEMTEEQCINLMATNQISFTNNADTWTKCVTHLIGKAHERYTGKKLKKGDTKRFDPRFNLSCVTWAGPASSDCFMLVPIYHPYYLLITDAGFLQHLEITPETMGKSIGRCTISTDNYSQKGYLIKSSVLEHITNFVTKLFIN